MESTQTTPRGIGEYLLSRGIDTIDVKQLSAGEGIGMSFRQKNDENRESDERLKMMTKFEILQADLLKATERCREETKKAADQAAEFQRETMDKLDNRDADIRNTTIKTTTELKQAYQSLQVNKETEIKSFQSKITTLELSLASAKSKLTSVETTLTEKSTELSKFRERSNNLKVENSLLSEESCRERVRNAELVSNLTRECQILRAATEKAAEVVKEKEHSMNYEISILKNDATELVNLKNELSSSEQSVRGNEKLLKNKEKTISTQQQELEILKISLTESKNAHTAEVQKMQIDITSSNEKALQLQQEIDAMLIKKKQNDQNLNELETKYNGLQIALQQSIDSSKTLDSERSSSLAVLTIENQQLKQQSEYDLAAAKSEAKKMMSEKDDLISQLKKTASTQQEQLEASHSDKDVIRQLREKLNESEKQVQQITVMKETIRNLEISTIENNVLRTKVTDLSEELSSCRLVSKPESEIEILKNEEKVELQSKIEHLTSYITTLETSLETCKQQNDVMSSSTVEIKHELNGLYLEISELKEERDALKETVTIGQYNALDTYTRTAKPVLSETEARNLRQSADDLRRLRGITARTASHVHTCCIQAHEVLSGFLTVLPSIPSLEDVTSERLESIHRDLSGLLRDAVRTFIESRRRETLIDPPVTSSSELADLKSKRAVAAPSYSPRKVIAVEPEVTGEMTTNETIRITEKVQQIKRAPLPPAPVDNLVCNFIILS